MLFSILVCLCMCVCVCVCVCFRDSKGVRVDLENQEMKEDRVFLDKRLS